MKSTLGLPINVMLNSLPVIVSSVNCRNIFNYREFFMTFDKTSSVTFNKKSFTTVVA